MISFSYGAISVEKYGEWQRNLSIQPKIISIDTDSIKINRPGYNRRTLLSLINAGLQITVGSGKDI